MTNSRIAGRSDGDRKGQVELVLVKTAEDAWDDQNTDAPSAGPADEVGTVYPISRQRRRWMTLSLAVLSCITAAGILLGALWLNGIFVSAPQPTAVIPEIPTKNISAHVNDTRTKADISTIPQSSISSTSSVIQPGQNIPVKRMHLPPVASSGNSETPPSTQTLTTEISITPDRYCSVTLSISPHPSRTRVLITIFSEPEDGNLRRDYRQIWKNYLSIISANLLFVMGSAPVPDIQESVKKEAEEHGDILQIGSPSPVTFGHSKHLKMLTVLAWAADYCTEIHFLIRMNIDVLVHPQSLKEVLTDARTKNLHVIPTILGDVIDQEEADPENPEHPPAPATQFPRFVYGSFYIISQAAFRPIVEACKMVRPISLEEVYLTGSCADYGNVQRVSAYQQFEMERDLTLWRKLFSCLPDHVLTVSNVGKDKVLSYWNKAVRAGCYIQQVYSEQSKLNSTL